MSFHEEYDPLPEPIVLNLDKSPLLIELNGVASGGFFTNPSMLEANVSQYTRSKIANKTVVEMKSYRMEICNESHISGLEEVFQEYFRKKNLANFFCIPKALKNLTMEGAFDQDIFRSIKFSFSVCTNDAFRSDCLEKEAIKTEMRRGFIGIYFLDISLDAGNYDQSAKAIPKEVFTNYVIDFQKEIDIYYKNNYLVSDEGWIFGETVEEKMTSYEEFQELNFMVEDTDFLYVYLKVKQMKAIYGRNYSKIQDLLGLVGGFMNFFYIFGFFLNGLYVKLILISDILLDIFTVKISTGRRKLIQPQASFNPATVADPPIIIDSPQITERQRLHSGSEAEKEQVETKNFESKNNDELVFIGKNNEASNKLAPKILGQEEIDFGKEGGGSLGDLEIKSKKFNIDEIYRMNDDKDIKEVEKLDLTLLDYVYIYTGLFKTSEREQKKLMIDKGREILTKCLDIKYIIQKFYEIEKLKNLLLSESQSDLFMFLPKPEIMINYKGIERNRKNRGKHSIHTRVLMRSSSLEGPINRMADKRKKMALMRSSTKKDSLTKKLTYLASIT